MTYDDIKYDILNTLYKRKYEFLNYENTSIMGAPSIALMIKGGSYISLIRNGDKINKVIIEKQKLAPNQNIKNPQGYSRDIILKIISSII